jgi:hypothetical protein
MNYNFLLLIDRYEGMLGKQSMKRRFQIEFLF